MNVLKAIFSNRTVRNVIIFAILVALIFIQGCRASNFKAEAEEAKEEVVRVENNYAAAQDTIRQYQLDEETWVAEKKGYEITIDELNSDYSDLKGKYEFEKNKPPKTITQIEYVIVEKVDSIPVYAEVSGDTLFLTFKDSADYGDGNFRNIVVTTQSPYEIHDSTLTVGEGVADFELEQGIKVRSYLIQDEDTKEVFIVAETDYPGVTFTGLDGAIVKDPLNKKALRALRKQFSIGINFGYGIMYVPNNNAVYNGPTLSVGVQWSPKFLQFGQ